MPSPNDLEQRVRERLAELESAGLLRVLRAPIGIDLSSNAPFYVFKVRPARRVGPDGQFVTELVIEIVQRRPGYFDDQKQQQADRDWREGKYGKRPVSDSSKRQGHEQAAPREEAQPQPEMEPPDFWFRGGCTLLVNVETGKIRYCIRKSVLSNDRLNRQREFLGDPPTTSLRATYFGDCESGREPFAMLHRDPV